MRHPTLLVCWPLPVFSEPAEAMEIRVAIQASDVQAEGERVTAAFKDWVDAGKRAGPYSRGSTRLGPRWPGCHHVHNPCLPACSNCNLAGCGGASHWRLEQENYEGWRVRVDEGDGKEGWLLLRPSLHDPGALQGAAGGKPPGCDIDVPPTLAGRLWPLCDKRLPCPPSLPRCGAERRVGGAGRHAGHAAARAGVFQGAPGCAEGCAEGWAMGMPRALAAGWGCSCAHVTD